MVDNGDVLYLGKFDHDLTGLPNPGIMVYKRNHPKMAQQFRLVKYYNIPRYQNCEMGIYPTYSKMLLFF